MSPLKSSFICLSLLPSLMVYAVFSLSAMLFIFKKQSVQENETDRNTTSMDRTVLHKRSRKEKGPGGGGRQENDEDKDVSSRVALLFIQANISVTKY